MYNKYLQLAQQNKEQIINALAQAFVDSVNDRHLKFNVELFNDGTIHTWYDQAGGNSFLASNMDGSSVRIASFCNQYLTIENNPEVETEEEWLDWYKDNYKWEEAEEKYYNFLEQLEERAKIYY